MSYLSRHSACLGFESDHSHNALEQQPGQDHNRAEANFEGGTTQSIQEQ